ncbi:MAG: hypothetical protein ACI8S6_002091 [Myxococcota bacterium]
MDLSPLSGEDDGGAECALVGVEVVDEGGSGDTCGGGEAAEAGVLAGRCQQEVEDASGQLASASGVALGFFSRNVAASIQVLPTLY